MHLQVTYCKQECVLSSYAADVQHGHMLLRTL